MKKQTTSVYLGSPIEDPTERHFLERLRGDLDRRGLPAMILANFMAGKTYRQIDFLIVRPDRAVHCELKGYSLPVMGTVNGLWHQIRADGSHQQVGDVNNPYRQAQEGTYAISDDMADFARRNPTVPRAGSGPFFKSIDTVLCIYPAVPGSSKLERFPYVAVLGYNELLERVAKPGPHPRWTFDQWAAFIRFRALYPPDERSAGERVRDVARQVCDDYRSRFIAVRTTGLHELVSLRATADRVEHAQLDLATLSLEHAIVQMQGPSGTGKTHYSLHSAIQMARQGHVPLWIRCGEYQAGQFDVLLRRAIAPYTNETAGALFGAAEQVGAMTVLILDGFNECPPDLRAELLEEVLALTLVKRPHVLITSQVSPQLPEKMAAMLVELQAPDQLEVDALVRSYGAEPTIERFRAFHTPLELSIASAVAASLPVAASIAELYDAYVRTMSSEQLRADLRLLARAMDTEVRTTLPLTKAIHMLERRGVGQDESHIGDVMQCRLLTADGARVGFRHELLGRFLAADDLVARAATGVELGQLLSDPRHVDLRVFALGLEQDSDRLRDVVRLIADPEVLSAALAAKLGATVQAVVVAEAEALLTEATHATDRLRVWFEPDLQVSGRWRGERNWTPFERALFGAIGWGLVDGLLVDPVIRLLDRTDDVIEVSVRKLQDAGDKLPISRVVAASLGLIGQNGPDTLAAVHILGSLDLHAPRLRRSEGPNRAAACAAMWQGVRPNSRTRLSAALLLVDAEDASNVDLLPALLTTAWNARGYHLRLQVLETARFLAYTLPEEDKVKVLEVLEGMHTENLMLNTALVEALGAYDAIQPIRTLDQIQEELQELLDKDQTPQAWVDARTTVLNQLEEEAVVGAFTQAIGDLTPPERAKLMLMALRGTLVEEGRATGMFDSFVLDEFLRHGNPDDPIAKAALIEAATHLTEGDPFEQSLIEFHLKALEACARFSDAPPPLKMEGASDSTATAWVRMRNLIFSLARGSADLSGAADDWSCLLNDVPSAAVGVLYQFHHAALTNTDRKDTAHWRLIEAYPAETCKLLEWGLRHRDKLWASRTAPPVELSKYVIRMLGEVGDAASARLLRSYVADTEVGRDAVSAVRRIEQRWEAPVSG